MYDIFVIVVRTLLGLVFIAGAANGMLILTGRRPFMPVNRQATDFLLATGYLYPLVKVTELLAGILLLSGLFVPAALLLLAPVVLNIFWMHLLYDKPMIGVAVLLLALELFLGFAYREAFVPLLEPVASAT